MSGSIITFNAGSSSLKFSLFNVTGCENGCDVIFHGQVDDIGGAPCLSVYDADGERVYRRSGIASGHEVALSAILTWYESHDEIPIVAAGHRVVHGGREFVRPVVVTGTIMKKLEALISLAPLHQPHNLETIRIFAALHPGIPQIACFDTAFHRTQAREAELFALPRSYYNDGIIRYGFHGLSYEYIVSILPDYADADRVVVAHLGNGASMCAMKNRKSIATTMGFTTLDGLMMGTRCGALDPGIVLYLLEEKGMKTKDITKLLYKESGLRGVSGISNDMRELLASDLPEAKEAVELFCYSAAKHLASLIPVLGGLDAIVFTAGIGENSLQIRKNICIYLSWLGVDIADDANGAGHTKISADGSKVGVYVLPTDEELVIAKSVLKEIRGI